MRPIFYKAAAWVLVVAAIYTGVVLAYGVIEALRNVGRLLFVWRCM